MKKIRVLFLLVLVLILIKTQSYLESRDQGRKDYVDCTENNCGKVEGYIVDPETNQKVNTQFAIWIGECGADSGIHFGKRKEGHVTRPDGSFSFFVQPGTHCIQFAPNKTKPDPANPNLTVFLETKYAFDPDPAIAPEQIQKITVKAGQIVKIVKKAKIAGRIKITLVDKAGNKVIPNGDVNANVIFSNLQPSRSPGSLNISKTDTGDLKKDGEITFGQLLPWKYDLEIDFGSLGYGSQYFSNLSVEVGETLNLKVILDLNDQTGIQGCILDQNGNPISNANINISEHAGVSSSSAGVITDTNGQYKIVGLKEKTYIIYISKYMGDLQKALFEYKPELNYVSPYISVYLKKNQIIRKDIVLNLAYSNINTSAEKK